MKNDYDDIKARINERPLWYDQNGVPRYDKFHPDMASNIYAKQVILMEICCQNCGESFYVEMNWLDWGDRPSFKELLERFFMKRKEDNAEERCYIHYGDPPRHDCIGDTMNSEPIRILEFWHRPDGNWKRVKKYEIGI